jgi:hypothetical protein
MQPIHRLVCLATLALILGGVGRAQAEVITPTDARGIRQLPGQSPFLLDFLSINRSVEDRTVLQFDLRPLAGPVGTATLDLDLLNLDPGLPGVIDVYAFAGTGTVTPDQFSAGTLITSFASSASGLEHVDVTAAVLAAQDSRQQFLGFRLSTTSESRWLLGPEFGRAEPTLSATIIPEPTALALLGVGALGLLGYRWRWRRAVCA